MKSSRAWIVYSIIRLGIFAVVLAALLFLQVTPWVAAIAAAVIGLCVSYIFFRGPRDKVAQDIYARRHGVQRDLDNEIENAALDELEANQKDASETTPGSIPESAAVSPDPSSVSPDKA